MFYCVLVVFCNLFFICYNLGWLRKYIVNLNVFLLEICYLMIYKMFWVKCFDYRIGNYGDL